MEVNGLSTNFYPSLYHCAMFRFAAHNPSLCGCRQARDGSLLLPFVRLLVLVILVVSSMGARVPVRLRAETTSSSTCWRLMSRTGTNPGCFCFLLIRFSHAER